MSDKLINRRQFLQKSLITSSLAVSAGIWGYAFYSSDKPVRQTATKIYTFKDYRVQETKTYPDLVVCKNTDTAKAVRAVVDRLGGMSRFIKPGESVLIKPNASWDRQPEQAANTNPEVIGTLVKLCLEAKASVVWVSDVPVNDGQRTFTRSGILQSTLQAGGIVKIPTDNDFVPTDLKGEVLQLWPVSKFFHQVDKLINVPVVKHHSLSKCTIAMKNLYGVLGGQRNMLHQDIYTSIADLAVAIKPTLTIMDATRVLMRNGPTGGNIVDVATFNTVAGSVDTIAIETYALKFLNLKPEDIPAIDMAVKRSAGKSDLKALHIEDI